MNLESLTTVVEKNIIDETGMLKDFRLTHLALLKKNGFKEVELDSYKFTNLETFFDGLSYEPKNFDGKLSNFDAPMTTLRFVDGVLESSEKLPIGVVCKNIKSHFTELKDLFQESNSLSHLHHALLHSGVVIQVEKNTEVSGPIRILNILTKTTATAPTFVLVAHPFSKVTLFEETRSLEMSHANICETYIYAHPGSSVTHISLDSIGTNGVNHGSLFAEVEKDATVKSFFFNTSGKMNRRNLKLNLNSPGANGESYCLFLTNGKEHSDINTVINHKAADTTSNQIAKGILDQESKGIFTGKIHIFPKAQRVASGQLNKNLLLSKKAQVHSQPQLEIFADDVKCSHGSTTGQLSDDEVFYFQARGIAADKARTLLALGFGLEVVQKIENKIVREYISQVVKDNLSAKFSIGGVV